MLSCEGLGTALTRLTGVGGELNLQRLRWR
jgi:hypothetical protein